MAVNCRIILALSNGSILLGQTFSKGAVSQKLWNGEKVEKNSGQIPQQRLKFNMSESKLASSGYLYEKLRRFSLAHLILVFIY